MYSKGFGSVPKTGADGDGRQVHLPERQSESPDTSGVISEVVAEAVC